MALEITGPVCNLRDVDLGIAVGSAAKTAALHSIDCRCQTRAATAARKLGLIQADHAVALSLSMTHKAVGFDRPMPEADFDTLDLPPTGTQPVGISGATRQAAPETARHPASRSAAPILRGPSKWGCSRRVVTRYRHGNALIIGLPQSLA